jgi:hypothetical protein
MKLLAKQQMGPEEEGKDLARLELVGRFRDNCGVTKKQIGLAWNAAAF